MNSTFANRLKAKDVSPLWDVMANLVTAKPHPAAGAFMWQYEPLRELLMEAGGHITAEEAERRVLILENPEIAGSHRVTDSLYAGLQLVLPGEIAPVHRHSQSALRFVLESEGSWTALDGEKVMMHPFDLVLTPNWRWHEHGGEGAPAIWLDGLDIPIIETFAATFAERDGNVPAAGTVPEGACQAAYGSNLRPVNATREQIGSPLFHFPYAKWSAALAAYSNAVEMDSHLGWMMEFNNPATGGSAMETISAFCQKVSKGKRTAPRKQSSGAVYAGVSGNGTLFVDGKPFQIGPRDIVAVPSWCALEIKAGDEDLVLFSYSDRTCHEKLGFWREERM